jgi:hypothetical protein
MHESISIHTRFNPGLECSIGAKSYLAVLGLGFLDQRSYEAFDHGHRPGPDNSCGQKAGRVCRRPDAEPWFARRRG